jgi:hypothetical protein
MDERSRPTGRPLGRILVAVVVLVVVDYLVVTRLRTPSGRAFLRRLPYGA